MYTRKPERNAFGPWDERNRIRNREIEAGESCRWCERNRVHQSEFCRAHRPIAARGDFNAEAKAQAWSRNAEAEAILTTAEAEAAFLSDSDGETERTAVTLSATGPFARYGAAIGMLSIADGSAIKWCPTRAFAEAWAASVTAAGVEAVAA